MPSKSERRKRTEIIASSISYAGCGKSNLLVGDTIYAGDGDEVYSGNGNDIIYAKGTVFLHGDTDDDKIECMDGSSQIIMGEDFLFLSAMKQFPTNVYASTIH